MGNSIGVILIDGNEIVLQIFTLEKQQWVLFCSQCYDLTGSTAGKIATSSEIMEVIADILFTKYSTSIWDWKICARGVQEDIVYDISEATGYPTELLTLRKDQELLCKGILMDME